MLQCITTFSRVSNLPVMFTIILYLRAGVEKIVSIRGHLNFYNLLQGPYWIIEHIYHTNLSDEMAASASVRRGVRCLRKIIIMMIMMSSAGFSPNSLFKETSLWGLPGTSTAFKVSYSSLVSNSALISHQIIFVMSVSALAKEKTVNLLLCSSIFLSATAYLVLAHVLATGSLLSY